VLLLPFEPGLFWTSFALLLEMKCSAVLAVSECAPPGFVSAANPSCFVESVACIPEPADCSASHRSNLVTGFSFAVSLAGELPLGERNATLVLLRPVNLIDATKSSKEYQRQNKQRLPEELRIS